MHPLAAEHIDEIINLLKEYNEPICFVGSGAIVNKDLLLENFKDSTFSNNNDLNAYKLGIAGFKSFKKGDFKDAIPLYLRKSQAERMLEK